MSKETVDESFSAFGAVTGLLMASPLVAIGLLLGLVLLLGGLL